ncbi:DUF4232 domain-containing protein [Streptomyces cyaneus]|uniref:DUF4232 domain-containing protein n=1 Tax=Streptomyces cyaneus TaxID=1904 RepID=UPI000FF8A029|nr:DUF4232 domain-containing protein [Streptomyces cyaneus]
MAHAARSRRTTAVLAALSLGILALTACNGDAEKGTAAPSAVASPSAAAADKGSETPSTAGPGDGGSAGGGSSDSGGSTPPSSESRSDDGQDGGVGMCETTDLSYNVTVASKPVNHALLTATNKGSDPCLLPTNDLVITIPGLDGAAEHMGPDGKDWILKAGERAYAGIMFSRADTAGGKSADKVEVALTSSESPATVPIDGGPVTVNDGQVTSFFGTAEDALTY